MPLNKLGPYEILAPIGAGGMGEVWKARDTRLDRIVAIKRLNAEHSERFKREARAIAALNHPHICQLYDVGIDYLVMEYVEGTPLRFLFRRKGDSLSDPDRLGPRRSSLQRHHSPRPETRKHPDHPKRRDQAARLRTGEVGGAWSAGRYLLDADGGADRGGSRGGHSGLHVTGTGTGTER